MRRSERIDAGIVDKNIDMAISEFDRFPGHFVSAVCAQKLGRNKIRFSSSGPNFLERLLPALRISPHNQNVNTKLSEFLGCRETDSARATRYKRCRVIVSHLQSLMATKASTEEYDIVIIDSGSTRACLRAACRAAPSALQSPACARPA